MMKDRRTAGRRTTSLLIALVVALAAWATAGATVAGAALELTDFDVTLTNDAGNPVTQAGAHANLTTSFTFATDVNGGVHTLRETLKQVHVDLPPGLLGDPGAFGQCSYAQLSANGAPGLPAGFPQCAPETQVGELTLNPAHCPTTTGCWQRYAIYNMETGPNSPAAFGINIGGLATFVMRASLRADRGYTIRVAAENVSQYVPILGMDVKFYGVPADHNGPPSGNPGNLQPVYDQPGAGPRLPFVRNATSCSSALTTELRVRSWEDESNVTADTAGLAQPTGCDQLAFDPTISVRPTSTTQADAPSAYEVKVGVPQSTDPDGLATPDLRRAVVRFPEGVAIAPPSASGLKGCTDAEVGISTDAEPTCPEASKIGEVSIDTPLLAEPLTGEVYLLEPKPDQMFRLALVARGSGILVKLPGTVDPDDKTGQITSVFDNTPQLPFTELTLTLKGGSRAPLANPQTCGTKEATTELTSHAGPVGRPTSSFEIVGCAPGFAPTFEAGTLDPLAGGFSPFTMTVRRPDGHANLSGVALDLPPGLLGLVGTVPECPEAHAAAGTCGDESRIGTTTVEAGAGPNPFGLTGKVFLAGPYKGAPYSLAVVVRAIAGPFDLGTVVVRSPIQVDAANAKIGAPADPLPTILEGVPLRLRAINITIDRPGFMFNPTSCDPMTIGARLTSEGGAVAAHGVPFQARGCAGLPLRPQLTIALRGRGETTDGKHPGLVASLTQERPEANLKRVEVKLPLSMALDPDNAQALCTPEQAAAAACPQGSIVGGASVVTPALRRPLAGHVYFVEGRRRTATGQVRRTLPKLWLALRGEVSLDLWADSTVVEDHLVATFALIPDAPIQRFDLALNGGRNGILVLNTDICQAAQHPEVTFVGQTGKRIERTLHMRTDCGFRISRREAGSRSVRLTVSGIGAGKLQVSGDGILRSRRTVKGRHVANILARLDQSSLRALRSDGKVSRRVTVTFTPAGASRPRRTTSTITVRAQRP